MTEERDRGSTAESGAVLILFAILLPVIIGLTGLALDLGSWYLRASREQKAADAGALAGSIYLPDDPTRAFAVAREVVKENGYQDDGNTKVMITQEPKPSRIRVSITQDRKNFFAGLFGLVSTEITKSSVAEFQGPVPMGSPANTFGNEPLGGTDTARWSTVFTTPATQPLFWANVAGPASPKRNGDAHQAGVCTAGDDHCTGAVNDDYSPNGYFYTVHVPRAGTVAIDSFDPAFVAVGDLCDTNLAGASAATNPYVTDAPVRYAPGTATGFCTGDVYFSAPVTTTFVVRAPSDTPWDPMSSPVISTGSCQPRQYKGWNEPLGPKLSATDPDSIALQQVFRRWVRLCTFAAPTAGDYLVQVRTNAAIGNPTGAPSLNTGGGHNRFSLRAGFVDGAGAFTSGAGVRIFASTTMAIYANVSAATTQFHLVRIPSGSGGRTLVLSFFDVGDADNGNLRIVAPPDSGVTFTNCTATEPRAGTHPTCAITTNNREFQGQWIAMRVPIPSGYTCNDGSPSGCWVRVEFDYPGAVNDTTTWAAAIEGDPVRLVE